MRQLYSDAAAVCAVLHNVFYLEPSATYLSHMRDSEILGMWPILGEEERVIAALGQIQQSLEQDTEDMIRRDFNQLFEVPGEIKAYPWGSVYTDKENLLMGESTRNFSDFCRQHQLTFELPCHQPVDHIGLIMAVSSQLFKQAQSEAVGELIEVHLLPWSHRFTELVCSHSLTGYYSGFAMLLEQMLEFWRQTLVLAPKSRPLYY